jgi:hypothetical protein
MRRFLIGSSGVLAIVLGLALLDAAYESVSEAADARAYPPPGQMVDVGGYRLHINCVGAGSPTVVIESGLGDWSASWSSSVQPQVARTTRVCTYDRAGMGDSMVRSSAATDECRRCGVSLAGAEKPGSRVRVGARKSADERSARLPRRQPGQSGRQLRAHRSR